jgi:hypothetical protein
MLSSWRGPYVLRDAKEPGDRFRYRKGNTVKKTELLWLAGILEGDGSFCFAGRHPRVSLYQRGSEDVVQHAAMLMQSKVYAYKRRGERVTTEYAAILWGTKATALAEQLYPHMGAHRQEQITHMIARALIHPAPIPIPKTRRLR